MANKAVIEVGIKLANTQKVTNDYDKALNDINKNAEISPEIDDSKIKGAKKLIQELHNEIEAVSHDKLDTSTFNEWSEKIKGTMKELQDTVGDVENTVQSLIGAMSKSGNTALLDVLKNMSDASTTLNKSLKDTISYIGKLDETMLPSSKQSAFFNINSGKQLDKLKEAKGKIKVLMSDYKTAIESMSDEISDKITGKKAGEVQDFLRKLVKEYEDSLQKVSKFNPLGKGTEALENNILKMQEIRQTITGILDDSSIDDATFGIASKADEKIADLEKNLTDSVNKTIKRIDDTIIANAERTFDESISAKRSNRKSNKPIDVQVHIAEGSKGKLLKELSSIVELLTADMQRHPVEIPVDFKTKWNQRENKRLLNQLKTYVKGSYDQMSDAERSGFDKVISKLEKQLDSDIPLKFRTNIKDVEASVQHGLKAINQALKDNKDQMKIYPDFIISDEAKANLQEQLNKITKSFQVVLDDIELTSDFGNKVESKIADAGKDGAKQAANAVEEVLDEPREGFHWDEEAQGFVADAVKAKEAINDALTIKPEINHIHFDIDNETLASLTNTFKKLQTMADRISKSLLGTDKVDAYTKALIGGLTEVAQKIDSYFGSGHQLVDLSDSADKMKADFIDAIDAIETKVVEFTNKFPELFGMTNGATNITDNTKITETTEKASESLKDVSENADKASSSVQELSKNQNLDNFLAAIKQVGGAFTELENSAKNVSSSLFNIEEINNWKKAFIDAITDIAIKYQDVFGGASSLNKLMDTFKGWYQGDADRLNFYQNHNTKNWESTGTKGKKRLIEIPTNERALIVDKNGNITHEFGYYMNGGSQSANKIDPSGVKGAIATIHSHSERLIPSLSASNEYSNHGVRYVSGDLRSALLNSAPNGVKYQAATGVNGLQVLDIQKFVDALEGLGDKLKIEYDSLDNLYQEIFGNISEKTTKEYTNEAIKGIIGEFGNTTIEEAIGNLFNSVSQGNLSNDLRDKFVKVFKNILDNSGNLYGLGSSISKAIDTTLKNVTDETSKQGLINIQSYWNKQGASGNLLGIIGDLFKNAGISIPKGYDTQLNIGAMLSDYLNTSTIKDIFKTNGINPDTFLQTYTYDQFKKKNPMGLSQGQFQSLFSNIKIDTTPFDQLNKILDEITGKITSLQSAMGSIGDSNFSVMVKESDELSGSLQQITETLVKIANTLEEIKTVSNGITTNNNISGSVKETDNSLNSIEENIKSIVNVLTEAKGTLDLLNESLKSTDASTEGVVSAFKELYGKKMTDDKMNNLVDNFLSYKKLGGQKNNLGEILSDAGLNVSDKTLNKYESQIRKILNVREELSSKNVTTAPLPFTNVSDINQNNIEATTKQLKELRTAISGIQNGLKRINESKVNDTFFNDKNIATIKELTDALQELTALKINETDAQSMDAIQKSLKKISNISAEDINSLADALKKLLDALNGDVKSNGFVNALNQLAGADLKGLLKVLNTSPSTLEKAAKTVGDSNYNAGDILKQYGEKSIDDAIQDYFKDIAEVFSVSTRTLKDGMLQATAYVQDIDDTGKAVGAFRKATFKVNENGSVTQLGSESSAKIADIVRELKSMTQAEQEAADGADKLGNELEEALDSNVYSSEAIIPGSDAWAEAMANFDKLGDKAKEIGDILSIKRQARLDKNDQYAISDLFVGTKGTFDTGTDSPILFSEQTIANTKEMQNNVKEIEKTAKEYYDLVGKRESGIITQSEVNQLDIASDKLNELISQVKQYDDLLGSHTTIGKDLTDALNNAGNDFTGKIEADLRKKIDKINTLVDSKAKNNTPYLEGFLNDIKDMNAAKENVSDIVKSHESGTQYSVDEINKIFNSVGEFNRLYSGYNDKDKIQVKSVQLDKLLSKIIGSLDKHSGAPKDLLKDMESLRKKVEDARDNIETFSDSTFRNTFAPRYEELNAKMSPYGESFTARVGKSLRSTNAQFISQFFGFYDIIRYGQEAFQTVLKLDNEMTELAKVSNASGNVLNSVFSNAADTAQELGVSIDNVLTSVTDWNRLGYSIADSEMLAKTTELFEVVGDSMTQQSSQEGLTSIMKGWNMTADQSMSILDKLNEVANNYSVTTNDEVEAITRGGAQLSSAGNDLSQSLGMIVAANDAVRNPSSVGTMLKTFSMRLRGANSSDLADLGIDTTGMASGTKSVVQIFKHMAGIDIMDGTDYKSTYDILDELASKWQSLTDVERAALSEAVGGKRGGSIMASLMTNWQDAKDVVETANNSQGSAEREQKNREKSIQVSLNRAKSQVEEVIADMADKGVIKGLINGFTKVLQLVEKITSQFKGWSVIPLGGAFLFFERLATGGISGLAKDFKTIGDGFSSVINTVKKGEVGDTLKGSLSSFFDVNKNVHVDDTIDNRQHITDVNDNTFVQKAQDVTDAVDEMDEAWGKLNQNPELGNMDAALDKVEQEAQDATKVAIDGASEVVEHTGDVTEALSKTSEETAGVKKEFGGLGASIKGSLGGILFAIGAVVTAFTVANSIADSVIAKEKEASEQSQKNVELAEQNVKNAQRTIGQIKQGNYDVLRKGVDINTNKNLSLTDDDYQRYLDYNDKIADLVPQVVAGYDSQGHAVIKYTNKIKDLNDVLKEYNANQIKQKNGLDDSLLQAIKDYKTFQQGNNGTFGSMLANNFKGTVPSTVEIDYINELLKLNKKERKKRVSFNISDIFYDKSILHGADSYSRGMVQANILKEQNISEKDLYDTKTLKKIKERINSQLDSIISRAKKTIQVQAQATDGFYDLNDAQQKFISTLISNSDNSIINILNSSKSNGAKRNKIEGLAKDAISTTDKLSNIDFVGANGKKINLFNALSNFDKNAKKIPIRNLQDFYDDIDDELRKHFSDNKANYLERTLGLKDKQNKDVSRQYKDKILNVVNGIKNGITKQQRTDMIDSLMGMNRSDVDSFLTSASQLKSGVTTYNQALEALKLGRIKNAAQADINVLAYDSENENISNLQQAIANSQGVSGLSKTDVNNIKTLYQGLEKYNPDKLFENTTEGIHLNQKALAELNNEYVKTRKSEISDALNEQYTALIKCQEAMKNASGEDKAALETQKKQIQENIDLIAEQASMYDGLTSKYAEWQRAQQTPNEGANNEAIGNYWKTAKDLAKDFKFGTDDMRSFVGLISGKDLSTAKVAEVRKEWERIINLKVPGGFKLTDLYTDDYQGSARFLQAVHATNPNWASQDKNGSWKFDFEPQDLADKWGVNVEVIENMIKQLGDYIDVTLDDTAKDAKSKMESLIHEYEIIGKDGKTFKITIDTSQAGNQSIMEINENIKQVEQNIKDINDGTIDPKANEANLKKLRNDFKTLVKYKAQAESQIHFHIDTSKLTKQGKKGFQTLTQYYQLRYEYRESKKTGDKKLRASIAKDVKAKRKEVDAMVKADPTIADELNIPLTAQGTVNWKGFKTEKGKTVKGLDDLINSGAYINNLKSKFSNKQSITVTVKTNKGQINATNKDLEKVSKRIDKIRGKSNTIISVGYNTISFDLTNNALSNFYNKLRDIRNNSHINVTVNQKTVKTEEDHTSNKKKNKKGSDDKGSQGGSSSRNISGQTKLFGQNNESYANGKDIKQSSKTKGKALVGELGAELLVRNGHYQTIGDDGAEMIDVYPSDIIFNHEQTKKLLQDGKINSRGKAFFDGLYHLDDNLDDLLSSLTAEDYDDDENAYVNGKSFATGGGYLPMPKRKKTTTKKKRTSIKHSSSPKRKRSKSNSKSKSSYGDWADVNDTDATEFDWIEIKISRLNEDITQLDYNINRTYLRWGVRASALNKEINKTDKLITNTSKGSQKYLSKANSIVKNISKTFKNVKQEASDGNKKKTRNKYSSSQIKKLSKQFKQYAKLVREGNIKISEIKNPDLAKAVQEYQIWYEKYRSARDQVQQAIDKRHDLRMQRYEQANIIRSDRQTLQQTKRSGIDSREEFLETHGVQTVNDVQKWYDTGVDTYEKELKQEKKKNADLKKQREETIDDVLGVVSEQDEKAYNKAKKDKAKILPKLKKVFGTSDLQKIQKSYETTAKKKKSGKKLTKSDKTKLKAYSKYYKEVLKDQSTIDTVNDARNALKYVNLDKTEKKKYTNAQADKKLRETRLKKAFGTTDLTKIQSQYDALIAKRDNGEKLTKKQKTQIQSYKNNVKKLANDKAIIQEVRDAIAETSDDVIKLDNDIAESDNNLAELQYESVNRYFDMLDKKMTAVETKYTNLNVQAEGALSRIDSIMQLSQSKGYLLSGKFYDEQIKYQKQEGENIRGQLQESLELLKQYPADTKEYYDAYNKVVDLGNQDLQNKAKVAQLEKEQADLEWTKIERKHTYIGYLNDELSWLESIVETEHSITDAQTGRFNDYGVSALATYAKQYNIYMVEADEWAKDVEKVKAMLDKDPNNTELQDKYQTYMQNWRSTITSAESARKSMSNLMKQQYDAELAALKTVLDYRKKELEAQKSIYQYQKDITEKSRSVESIEKQLMAFQNDTSEEGKARTEKLKDQLRTAKQSLQETEYNQYVSDQEEILDNIYTEFQNMFEDKMDDMEQVVKDALKIVNENQSLEVKTLDKTASDVGYKITDSTKNILNSQSQYYTNTIPGEFENLCSTITSEVANINQSIMDSENASEQILNENIDKLITQLPKPITLEELENIINGNTKSSDDSDGSSGNKTDDSNTSGSDPVTPSAKGDYKEYFSKTGKYTNADDDINVSRHKRVTDAVDHSDTKHSNKKAKKGTLEYFLYHTYGAGNTNTDLINYWNAIHGDHKKKVKDKLSSAEKKDLMAWFKAFYSDGGTIGKAIKMTGEDGMILAKTGEEVLSIEKVKELQKALALLQPIHNEFNHVHSIPNKTVNNSSIGDVSIIFNMPNVSNYEDFANKLKSDTNMQKYIQQITIGQALGQNSLLKKKF